MKNEIPFIKMHGLGNDFVIIDNRTLNHKFKLEQVRNIASRNFGIGCDQLVLIENSSKADCFMRIYNKDGGEVESCGNASRCTAWLMANEKKSPEVKIETLAGVISAKINADEVAVNMGKPVFDWQKIPLAENVESVTLYGLSGGVPLSMGNPHVVFFVGSIKNYDLHKIGHKIENDKLFPKKTNVEIAEIVSNSEINLKVWERGAGATLACGTGASATLVAAVKKGLTGRKAKINLPGGKLDIEWDLDDNVIMSGKVSLVFNGSFSLGAVS